VHSDRAESSRAWALAKQCSGEEADSDGEKRSGPGRRGDHLGRPVLVRVIGGVVEFVEGNADEDNGGDGGESHDRAKYSGGSHQLRGVAGVAQHAVVLRDCLVGPRDLGVGACEEIVVAVDDIAGGLATGVLLT
jgi:hypothetical protein